MANNKKKEKGKLDSFRFVTCEYTSDDGDCGTVWSIIDSTHHDVAPWMPCSEDLEDKRCVLQDEQEFRYCTRWWGDGLECPSGDSDRSGSHHSDPSEIPASDPVADSLLIPPMSRNVTRLLGGGHGTEEV